MSLNRVTLVGRLTRDPEARSTSTGKNFATFSIAVRKRFKPQDPNERDADFFNIKTWGQSADYVTNYLNKGRLVAVDGRLETRRYTAQDGSQRDVTEVIAENVYAMDSPRDDAAPASTQNTRSQGRAPAAPAEEYDPFADD